MFGKLSQMVRAYRLWTAASHIVTNWRKNVPTDAETTVAAGVKSAWASKVNWNSIVMLLIGVASFFGYKISETDQATIMAAIMSVGSVVTIILRTFFTKSLTKGSV